MSTMFFNVKNLPLARQYRKRLLQISAHSVRNIHNHAKVEKTSATCNNKRSSRLSRLKTWDGRLIADNMHDIFAMQNKLLLSTIFPAQQKNFSSYWRIFQIIPYHTSHPKDRVVNVCKNKFAFTNVTPKRRNGAHFITHAPHCAWVMIIEVLWALARHARHRQFQT